MSHSAVHKDLESFKTRIIDSTLLVGTLIGLMAFLVSVIPKINEPFQSNFYTDICTFIILFGIYLFRKRLSPKTKTIIVICALNTFIITDALIWGVFSFNKIILVLVPFYSFLVFGFKRTLIIYFLGVAAYLSIGLLQFFGYIIINPDLERHFYDYGSWIESVIILSVVGIIIVIFTQKYYSELSKVIMDLEKKNIDLLEREKSLAIEQTFTSGLLEGLPGVFNLFKKSEEGHYQLVKWNKNTLKVTGLTEDELFGLDPFYIIHPDYREVIEKVVKNISAGIQDGANAKSWNAVDNEKSEWFYFTGHPITYSEEDYFIGLGIDISEQKRAEMSLGQEKAFSDSILDIIPGMFYLYEKEGDHYYLKKWNENHEVITGYNKAELLDMKPLDFFSPEYHDSVKDTITQLNENKVVTLEAPIVTKKGKGDFWYFITQKIKDEEKEYFIGIGIDIADRKVMERELEHRNLNLKDMLNDMQLRNNKLAEYAFINSHLLRAPLVRILGLAEMVSKEVILSEHQELLASFKTSAEELDTIVTRINDILDQRRDLNREEIIDALNQLGAKKNSNSSEDTSLS